VEWLRGLADAVWRWIKTNWGYEPDPGLQAWLEVGAAVAGILAAIVVPFQLYNLLWAQPHERRRQRQREKEEKERRERQEAEERARRTDQALRDAARDRQLADMREMLAAVHAKLSVPAEIAQGPGGALLAADEARAVETIAAEGGSEGETALKDFLATGRLDEARGLLRRLAGAQGEARQQAAQKEADYWRQLGALSYRENVAEALAAYAKAAELEPDHAMTGLLLARLQMRAGDLAAAGRVLARLAAQENRVASPHERVWVHLMLGDVQLAAEHGGPARASYERAKAIAEDLVRRDPANTEWQRDLSVSHTKLGDLLVREGDRAGALAAYRAGLTIAAALAQRDPANTEWQRDLSVSFSKLGALALTLEQPDEAREAFGKDLAIAQRLAAHDPDNAEWQEDLANSHVTLARLGGDGAASDIRAARDILRALADRGRLSPDRQGLLDALDKALAAPAPTA